jgi:hypothetical protein
MVYFLQRLRMKTLMKARVVALEILCQVYLVQKG